jgi:predicted secreted hydrolase
LTAEEEWLPHKVKVEWWYASGYLKDKEENLYFYQFTIFHGVKMGLEGYITHVAVSDYSNDKRYFSDQNHFKKKYCRFNENIINCGNHSMMRYYDNLFLTSETAYFDLELKLNPDPPVVWHGEDGIISMGYPEKPGENSFYYSYPSMLTTGKLVLRGDQGDEKEITVTGNTWFDRQWGNFKNTTWNWFSLRFADGDNIMLFHFPDTGHKEATYIHANNDVEYFHEFTSKADSSILVGKSEIGLKWSISIPYKDNHYTIIPLGKNDLNESHIGITYWEGLFYLLNADGEEVGYCVAEISR